MSKKDIKTSTTEEVMRSAINLNPYNPKRHTDEQVKKQVKNIKANGYLGGIVWNRTTGNLIDGHRRVQALDHINKYDGTPGTDYRIKVEVVEFDIKTEKEQMTYMALGNSKADYNLVAAYFNEIDPIAAGVTEDEARAIAQLAQIEAEPVIDDLGSLLISPPTAEPQSPVTRLETDTDTFEDIAERRENTDHASADAIKAKKEKNADVYNARNDNRATYIMLSFANEDDQMAFCEELGLEFSNNLIIDGLDFLRKLRTDKNE